MNLYHVLNRGVDKRNLVADDRDRMRFVRNLFEMNNNLPVFNMNKILDIRRPVDGDDKREPLVSIHGWCLMNNHYHLLLSELREGGMSKFFKKLNMGYSKYFNERHGRVGTLFQGKTKRKLIDNDAYFLWILHYIHFNPLDYVKDSKTWRAGKIKNASEAIAYLKDYRWSSFADYMGEHRFPEIITTSLMNGDGEYVKEARQYLRALENISETAQSQYCME